MVETSPVWTRIDAYGKLGKCKEAERVMHRMEDAPGVAGFRVSHRGQNR